MKTKHPKRPCGPNQLAELLLDLATDDAKESRPQASLSLPARPEEELEDRTLPAVKAG